jgi:hypothetical protein
VWILSRILIGQPQVLLRCHSYGDVVKLPMGRMADLLFRQPDLAMYLFNNPMYVKHVLVNNQHNYTTNPVPPVEARLFGGGGRRCRRESFAELEGLLIVATLASKVRLRLVDGQTILPDPLFTLQPNISMQMTIESVGTPEHYPTIV